MPKPSAISVFAAATSLLVASAPALHAQDAGGLTEWTTDQGVDEESVLDSDAAALQIDQLGYEEHQKELFLSNLAKPYGMFLVTGPTGSGKTVSLYTGINILNNVFSLFFHRLEVQSLTSK